VAGKSLSEYPLQNGVLFDQEVRVRGTLALLLEVAYLTSVTEAGVAREQEKAILSIFNPVLKLFVAKESLKVISEGLEAFGGVGYLEDSGLPAYLRNAQVLTIWEGTTNVLCMEFAKTFQSLGTSGLEHLSQYLRYTIDMTYTHPAELIHEKKHMFPSFQKMVLLYHALIPLFSYLTEHKGKDRVNRSYF